MRWAMVFSLLASSAWAQQAGWGNVGKAQEENGFSWTDPLFSGFWMAWTPATLAFFVFVFAAIARPQLAAVQQRGEHIPKKGALGHGVLAQFNVLM